MEATATVLTNAHQLVARAGSAPAAPDRPPVYKVIGVVLAIASGVFIGISFVLKKMGLLKANAKYNEEAGEGYGYLKNAWWWTGMILMIIGEICNFVAYAFVDAILVTPLGALSVVITTILSAIFLKERLSFVGKIGCFNCIIGSVVIVMNAPAQSAVADIQGMKDFVVTPGFLTYAGVIIVGCAFIVLWVGPRYGKKSMLVYLSVCSLIGGLSVVCTQGLGAAVIAQAQGVPQFNQWFLYVILVFVIATLLVEIVYLNVSTCIWRAKYELIFEQKALNLFNAALVTPTYYVFFTSATIVTSAILFQGFKGTPTGITTVIMGFLQICAGVVLLQMSKSAKDVPDAAVFKGDLDQIREIGEQEQPETEPKADAIRGTAAILRRISVSRQKKEEEEARRYREEKLKDQLEPLQENEIVEWDGLRRRKTVVGDGLSSPVVRRKTIHPPLGMSRFPDEDELQQDQAHDLHHQHSLYETFRTRASSVLRTHHPPQTVSDAADDNGESRTHPVALADIKIHPGQPDTSIEPYGLGSVKEARRHNGSPPGLKPEPYKSRGLNSPRSKPLPAQPTVQSPAGAPNIPLPSPLGKTSRRQFSFQNMFRGPKSPSTGEQTTLNPNPPLPRSGIGPRSGSAEQKRAMKTATEEERLGLVKGDSHAALLDPDPYPSLRPLSLEHYPYAATSSDSVASSPEARIPLVHKHSYLSSNSTAMPDNAPLYQDLHIPGYFNSDHASGYSAPPTPLEEEPGVDDEWQVPQTRREPQQPPTPHIPLPTFTATPPPPTPPPHEHTQLPPYHKHNPYQPRQQHSHESARLKAAPAASALFQNTPTSPHQNTTGGTTTRDRNTTIKFDSSSREPRPQTRTRDPPPQSTAERSRVRQETEAAQELEQAMKEIEVTSPGDQEFKERWRRIKELQQRKRDEGNAGAGRRDRGGGTGGSQAKPAAFI